MSIDNGNTVSETINMSLRKNYTVGEQEFFGELDSYWSNSGGTTVDKLTSFARFVPRQAVASNMGCRMGASPKSIQRLLSIPMGSLKTFYAARLNSLFLSLT